MKKKIEEEEEGEGECPDVGRKSFKRARVCVLFTSTHIMIKFSFLLLHSEF
jgi:hypothetical protein